MAQFVERDLAKVEAAGSSPVSRSRKKMRVGWKTNSYFFVSTSAHKPMQTCMGSESTLRSGPRKAEVPRTSCALDTTP